MSKLETGRLGELEAAGYLRRKGYEILSANYRSRFGEIDLIARDRKYIVFAEVKTRRSSSIFAPREAVDSHKQARLIKTASMFLSEHDYDLQPRFDVIEVETDGSSDFVVLSVRQIENAFMLPYK